MNGWILKVVTAHGYTQDGKSIHITDHVVGNYDTQEQALYAEADGDWLAQLEQEFPGSRWTLNFCETSVEQA